MDKKIIYFIYCFNNYFCLYYIDTEYKNKINRLKINENISNLDLIYDFISKEYLMIGYLNGSFESKLCSFILNNIDELRCLSNLDVCKRISEYSSNITDSVVNKKNEIDLFNIYKNNKSINSIQNNIYIPGINRDNKTNVDLSENKFHDLDDFCTRKLLEITLFYSNVFNDKVLMKEIKLVRNKLNSERSNNQSSLF